VVEQAIEVTVNSLPEALQEAQLRAILGVLSERMLAILKEQTMKLSEIPERPAVRELRLLLEGGAQARGEARGKIEGKIEGMRDALFTMLKVRGLAVSSGERATIAACTDATQLRQWIERAATVASTRLVLAAKPVSSTPTRPAPAPQPPARRQRASRPKAPGA
jgi:hypothetical protein